MTTSDRDQGFTLVEVVMAMAIATSILTAFAYASINTLHAMQIARLNQQGADMATQRLERVRNVPYGSLGHDPSGVVGDPHLSSCAGGSCYGGEPLVEVAGGFSPQITTTPALNNVPYTLYTYVTRPNDVIGSDNKRVTVIAEWAAYGRTWSKIMSTVVTQTQRGLPLPEFKLTPVGPSTITVNPGVTAAFGFQLSNQGAPDQWNITSGLPDYAIYLDNGDDVFNPAEDTTAMADHNGDGTADTGRLEPKESVVFWVVRAVPIGAGNSSTQFPVTAQAVSQQDAAGGSQAVQSLLIVTTAPITATPTPTPSGSSTPTETTSPSATASPTASAPASCSAANPAPTPSAVPGYNVKSYVSHNSGATSWPTFPLPATGSIPGSTAMSLMYMDMNPVSIPANRDLPPYSTDLSPPNSPGRLVYTGGQFTSTDASQLLDFRTQNPDRAYSGTMVLRTWVMPAQAGRPVRLSAQVYTRKTNGNQAITKKGDPGSLEIDPFTCSGFQEIWFSFPVGSFSAGNNTVLGVRVWNTGSDTVQFAYDHGLFPATFTVVEK